MNPFEIQQCKTNLADCHSLSIFPNAVNRIYILDNRLKQMYNINKVLIHGVKYS